LDSFKTLDEPPHPGMGRAGSSLKALKRAHPYIDFKLELVIQDLLTTKASMKGETADLLGVVMRWLEVAGVGDCCSRLVNAVDVLDRLGEYARGRLF